MDNVIVEGQVRKILPTQVHTTTVIFSHVGSSPPCQLIPMFSRLTHWVGPRTKYGYMDECRSPGSCSQSIPCSMDPPTIVSLHLRSSIEQGHRWSSYSIERPVSVNQGRLQPSWFDIWHLPPHEDEYDEASIAESTSIILDLVNTQIHSGIDSSRIVLVGFSQGAALSMMVGLKALPELGGLVSLSGWIPPRVRDVSPSRKIWTCTIMLICTEANDT